MENFQIFWIDIQENKPYTLAAIFKTNCDGMNNLDRVLPKENFCKVILKSVQSFLIRSFLKFSNIDTQGKQEGHDGPVLLTWLPNKCESIGLSIQEKKLNIDFQDGVHLGFPIRMILVTFDLQVTSILTMKFESIALLVWEKKFK